MTEKEMIEELAHTLYCKQDKFDLSNPFEVARAVVEEGYRKIPEGAVVLTEDNAEDVANMILNSSQLKETMDRLIKDWQKETAMEFGNFVKSKLFDLGNIVNESDIDDMLKEFCDEN